MMNATEELVLLKKLLAEKDRIIENQRCQIENITQALLHAEQKMFGPSSEVTKQIKGQFSIFENTDQLAQELEKSQQNITVPSYTRKTRQPGVRAEMLEGLEKEVEIYTIPEETTCPVCGGELKVVGRHIVRTNVSYIPAKIKVIQVVQEVRKCVDCGTKNSPFCTDHFEKAAVPKPILFHSIASPSLVAQILNQKFALGVPFARQERDWAQLGLILSRGNMAHWTIRCATDWFEPIYNQIHKELLKCHSLHMDETRIQCNKEIGKKASSNSFMWVMRSGLYEELDATYFYYSRTRGRKIAANLLDGYASWLTTDAYVGYEKLPGIKKNLCWAHLRRYFIKSIPLDSGKREIPGSKGAEGRALIDAIFVLEKRIKDLSPEEKKEKRQKLVKPALEVFWSWVDETSALDSVNDALTKALNYSNNQRNDLNAFLEDGALEISNNRCEAAIRPFATHRRSWLFADTPGGAKANAILYTLIETSKANDLNIFEYFKYILEELPNIDFYNHPELINAYVPWSIELPEQCKLKKKRMFNK